MSDPHDVSVDEQLRALDEAPDRDSEAALPGETPHEQARRLIGRALKKNIGRDGFRVLFLRLRQDYTRTLTDVERDAAIAYLEEQLDAARSMFTADVGSIEFEWPDSPDAQSTIYDMTATS